MATNNAVNLKGNGVVGYDGAGTFIVNASTNHAVHVGGATASAITQLAVGSNGQLLIGSTAADPVFATLGTTGGLSITAGAGTLTINGIGGGLSWSVITANQTALVNHGYICNKAGVLALAMPTVSAVGDVVAAININTAADTQFVSANPGQLQLGSSLATANTGTVTSTALGDVCFFVCTTANTTWYAYSVVGNWTIA